ESGLNDEYLIIRQYDAHAWVEAWLPESGWIRLDPTAMIAPERIELGLRESMRAEGSFLENSWASPERYQDLAMVNWLRLRADAMNFYWQRWVVGYQGQTQLSLFSRLPGNLGLRELGFATAGLVAFLITLSGLYALWRQRQQQRQDPYRRLYQRWLNWLKRQNIAAGPEDSPTYQAAMAAQALPQYGSRLRQFGQALNQVYYRPPEQSPTPGQIKKALDPITRLRRRQQAPVKRK
ncbi:MAG: transglutaminase domain-containing protein, partial [Halomonadaceae bacterium]